MEAGKEINLEDIRTDGGTQPRAALDDETVDEYREAMEDGAEFPPVIAFYDGVARWLADGFHRYFASRRAGFKTIKAIVKQGTQRDAILYSVGANLHNGLRRKPEDKRQAVVRMLTDDLVRLADNGKPWTDSEIGRRCAVDHKTVAAVRQSILGISQDATRTATRNGKTYEINTANIGRKPTTEKTTEVIDTETGEVLEDAEIVTTTVKHPTRILHDLLVEVSHRGLRETDRKGNNRDSKWGPRALFVKCAHAWNAHRKGTSTDLKYYSDSPSPKWL